MTTDMSHGIRASRYRVARSRGAMSGLLLVIGGAWAGIVPFIGPYINLAYTPAPNDAWHWTAARGWLSVAPGAAAFVGGLLLIVSASRMVTILGGCLAAAGGAWLIVGPPLAAPLNINFGTPDPTSSTGIQALEKLLFFYAIGAAILFVAGLALGRVSARTLRDVQAAQRRYEEVPPAETTDAAAAEAEGAGRYRHRESSTGPGTHAEPTYAPNAPNAPTGSNAPPPESQVNR